MLSKIKPNCNNPQDRAGSSLSRTSSSSDLSVDERDHNSDSELLDVDVDSDSNNNNSASPINNNNHEQTHSKPGDKLKSIKSDHESAISSSEPGKFEGGQEELLDIVEVSRKRRLSKGSADSLTTFIRWSFDNHLQQQDQQHQQQNQQRAGGSVKEQTQACTPFKRKLRDELALAVPIKSFKPNAPSSTSYLGSVVDRLHQQRRHQEEQHQHQQQQQQQQHQHQQQQQHQQQRFLSRQNLLDQGSDPQLALAAAIHRALVDSSRNGSSASTSNSLMAAAMSMSASRLHQRHSVTSLAELHQPGGPLVEFKCDICANSFDDRHRLMQHQSIHLELKPDWFNETPVDEVMRFLDRKRGVFLCNICNLRFEATLDYDQHNHAVHGSRPYCCQFCGNGTRTFKCWRQYLNHLYDHRYVFSCAIGDCDFTVNRRDSLRFHIFRFHLNCQLPQNQTDDDVR